MNFSHFKVHCDPCVFVVYKPTTITRHGDTKSTEFTQRKVCGSTERWPLTIDVGYNGFTRTKTVNPLANLGREVLIYET